MPLILTIKPVLHASGAWIASSGGYIAGTLSKTKLGVYLAVLL